MDCDRVGTVLVAGPTQGDNAMKKHIRHLLLHRETLQNLNASNLPKAVAGAATFPPVCENSGNAITHCTGCC
jgi:hypothetical protein